MSPKPALFAFAVAALGASSTAQAHEFLTAKQAKVCDVAKADSVDGWDLVEKFYDQFNNCIFRHEQSFGKPAAKPKQKKHNK